MSKVVKEVLTNETAVSEIPIKLLKEWEFTFNELPYCINDVIKTNKLPDVLYPTETKLIKTS